MKQAIEMAHHLGWLCAHFPTSNPEGRYRTAVAADAKGYPDCTFVRDRVIWVEFKSDVGRLRPEQAAWLAALLKVGSEVYVARPKDSGALQRVLESRGEFSTLVSVFAENSKDEIARCLNRQQQVPKFHKKTRAAPSPPVPGIP